MAPERQTPLAMRTTENGLQSSAIALFGDVTVGQRFHLKPSSLFVRGDRETGVTLNVELLADRLLVNFDPPIQLRVRQVYDPVPVLALENLRYNNVLLQCAADKQDPMWKVRSDGVIFTIDSTASQDHKLFLQELSQCVRVEVQNEDPFASAVTTTSTSRSVPATPVRVATHTRTSNTPLYNPSPSRSALAAAALLNDGDISHTPKPAFIVEKKQIGTPSVSSKRSFSRMLLSGTNDSVDRVLSPVRQRPAIQVASTPNSALAAINTGLISNVPIAPRTPGRTSKRSVAPSPQNTPKHKAATPSKINSIQRFLVKPDATDDPLRGSVVLLNDLFNSLDDPPAPTISSSSVEESIAESSITSVSKL